MRTGSAAVNAAEDGDDNYTSIESLLDA